MDFLYKYFKILNNYLTSPIIEIYKFKHDPDDPEIISLQYDLGPDEDLILEGIGFSINNLSDVSYRNKLFWIHKAFCEEVNNNLKISKSVKLRQEYLNKLINEITLFDKQICENDILYENLDSTYENKHNLEMDEFNKEGISDVFFKQKMLLRDTIIDLNMRLKEIYSNSNSRSNSKPEFSPKSFKLVSNHISYKKLKDIFKELKFFKFISQESGVYAFYDLFSEKDISVPLVWIAADGSLRYFIRELERRKIIHKITHNKWLTVTIAFENKKPGDKYTVEQISQAKTKEITEKQRRQLNYILDWFQSTD